MKWTKHSNIKVNYKLHHGRMYSVQLESGDIVRALFNVYEGGDEVAFLEKGTGKELSVVEFYA